ncbi:MAG: HNH endonuclease signature motif containing protein [Archangium sp.]|nr:HNH endonuclease signature motif containing protein [Archangium sp.]
MLKRKSQEVRAEFESRFDFVERAYTSFDFGTPEFMSVAGIHLGPEEDARWGGLYRYDQADIASLKEEIDLQLDGLCWYCRLAPADSLDHILPQVENPLFAVHSSNLVPACTKCNRKKNARNRNRRDTIYPYGEMEREVRWLFAKIELVENKVEVEFTANLLELTNSRTREMVSRHLDVMGVCEMYSLHFLQAGRTFMVAQFGRERGGRQVVDAISAVLPGYQASFGPNYYLSVGMEALSQCDDLTISAFLRK